MQADLIVHASGNFLSANLAGNENRLVGLLGIGKIFNLDSDFAVRTKS